MNQTQPPPKAPVVGTLGHYELIAKLGEGGMGTVYKAVHSRLERTVAIKVLPANRLQEAQAVARFQREMRAVGKLQHPNIVAAHDAGEIDGTHYLVMELVEGIDLAKLVSRLGQLPINSACELIRQAALGLQHAYEHNLVHRDIKPSNLMLAVPANSKTPPTVKILDLGLALLEGGQIDANELTSTGQVMGTIDYMAPEQGTDTHSVDIRADIYSLGATLYKLLTGVTPFSDPQYNTTIKKLMDLATKTPRPVENLRPDCPPELAQLVSRMLAKSPDDRPSTPEELATLLEPFAKDADLSQLVASYGPTHEPVTRRQESFVRTLLTADVPTFVTSSPVVVDQPAPIIPPESPRRRRGILAAAGAAAFTLLTVLIIVATNRGSIEIDVDADVADKVRVKVLHEGHEFNPNWRLIPGKDNYLTVRSGDVDVILPDENNEYELEKPGEMKVRRGEKVVFHLRRRDGNPVMATTPSTAPATTNPIQFTEPPPLEEWLKGREIVTVAQDGSGQFKTIQAALDALQSGQVVKVLDRGPYHERLVLKSPLPDLGLISEVQTQIDFSEPEPEPDNKEFSNGHVFEHLDAFRIHGFEFVMPPPPPNLRYLIGIRFFSPRDVVFENCFVRSEQYDDCNVALMLTPFGSNRINVIRDCVFQVCLSVYTMRHSAGEGSALVLRNYSCSKNVGATIGGKFKFFAARHNIFSPSVKSAVGLDVFHADWFDFSNNTLLSNSDAIVFHTLSAEQWRHDHQKKANAEPDQKFEVGHAPTGHGAIVNNLHHRTGFLNVEGGGQRDPWTWEIGNNVYPGDGEIPAENAMRRPTNTMAVPVFYSILPENAEYARLRPDSPGATSGAGGAWSTYAGALPPGPAPREGDWFTRLRERWIIPRRGPTTTEPTNVAPPIAIDEPPPLEEWLKGREIVTVAQDGRGHFKTIQSATDAWKPGQVIEVLDKGPYRESLGMYAPEDTGLISRHNTVIELYGLHPGVPKDDPHHGHTMHLNGRFRLHGFHFVANLDPKIHAGMVHTLLMGLSDNTVIENCRFQGGLPTVAGVIVHWLDQAVRNSECLIRDCIFDTNLVMHISPATVRPRSIAVRNWFRGNHDFYSSLQFTGAGGVGIARFNVFSGQHAHRIFLYQTDGDQAIEISNNTILNGEVVPGDSNSTEVTVRNNYFSSPIPFPTEPKADIAKLFDKWQSGNNRYTTVPKHGNELPSQKTDLIGEPDFLSKDMSDRNFLRIPAVSPDAQSGAGGSWPKYIGALPPGPAPKDGDWFIRLRERWITPTSEPTTAAPRIDIKEPPLLDEWLKGRTILTVAQDGSGQFKTIQEALNALQSGQVVKVLDKGPYRERLVLKSPLPDLGLISEVQTRIDFSESQPDTGFGYLTIGHSFERLDGFRIHGFEFVMPEVPKERHLMGIRVFEPRGVVLENCSIRCEQSDACFVTFRLTPFGSDQLNVIRDCVFHPALQVYTLREEAAEGSALILRNYFCSKETGLTADGKFNFFAARHNIFANTVKVGFFAVVFHADWFEFSNNTLFSSAEAIFMDTLIAEEWRQFYLKKKAVSAGTDSGPKADRGHAPTGRGAILNNLHHRAKFLNVTGGGERELWSWQIGYNCYPGDGTIAAENAMPRANNTMATPIFSSILPQNADFARLKPDSPGATTGAGGQWPSYTGALPPGPTPQEGDWFSRLKERWMK